MKKVAKAILLALGIILVIGMAVIVLGVNLYVQSAGTRARIEHGLGSGLHTPVKIGSVSFMPWYGLKIAAISGDDAEAPAKGNDLQISAIRIRFGLWRLMQKDVAIKELTVDGVKVSWTQNSEGKWEMPDKAAAANPSPETPEAPAPTTPPSPPPGAAEPAPASTPRPITVDHARMRNASFSFYDKNRRPLAEFLGVYVETPSPTDKLVEGKAAIANVVIQRKFYMQAWKGRFKYTPQEVSLFDTSCTVAGGSASGAVDVKIAEPDSPFAADIHFSGVDLNQLLTNGGVSQVQAAGTISGFVHLEGNSRDSATAQGKGEIVLAHGQITNNSLLEALGALLGTDQFERLSLDDAHASFHVGEGKVVLEDLTLKSPALELTSKGLMSTDGTGLYLLCRLAINADVVRQVPDFLLQNFATDASTGARFVDFPISGDIMHPKSTILDILGQHMSLKKGVNALLNNLLNKKQPAAPPPPAATPDPAPPQSGSNP